MKITELIEKKKKSQELTKEEINFIISSFMDGTIEDYQMSAFLMATYFTGMTLEETTYLTDAMIKSGQVLNFSNISENIIDKHSTGGVGDKITLLFLPLLSALGEKIAKLSGRGLGHTGGTIDKLDSIPGFNTNLTLEEFQKLIKNNGVAIASQTQSLTPADGKIYALRDVTSTIDIIPMIAASIVSKKVASGANHIILDVKCGDGAFMKTVDDAEKLSKIMVQVAKNLNRRLIAVVTDMETPLGRAIGNSIEIIEVIEFLKGNFAPDLKEVTYELISLILEDIGKFSSKKEIYKTLDEIILSGKALEKFKKIIEAQGGNTEVINNYKLLPQAQYKIEVKTNKSGYISETNAMKIALACKELGAGRTKKTDKIDYSVGIYLNKKVGEYADCGETIATIHSNDKEKALQLTEQIKDAFKFSNEPIQQKSLIKKVIK